jgi:membrane protease YdiL (CAAX protease family)
MQKIIRRFPISSFVLLTFALSWSLWLLMFLSQKDILPFSFPVNPFGSLGPAISALIITSAIGGKEKLRDLLKSLISWRFSVWMYAFALLGIGGLYFLAAVLHGIIVSSHPVFVKMEAGISLFFFAVYILILGGPLGEEIGWRGYLQPHLQEKFTPFTTSLIIGAIWSLWHLPLFWLEGAAQKGGEIPEFVINVFSMAFLFTWLYNQTRGSLFFAIIFHTSINFFSAIVMPALLPISASDKLYGLLFNFSLLSTAVVLVLLFKKTFFRKNA